MLNTIRSRFITVALCCLFLTSLSACESSDSDKTPVVSGPPGTTFPMPPTTGKSLNDLGWELSDGQRNRFSQYSGNVLILDFYATWCAPCRLSIPQLVDLQGRYKDQGLRVVGLNVGGPDDWPKVTEFARDLKIQYTLAVPETELTNFLLSDNQQIPQTFVFDRQGRLVKRLIGFSNSDIEIIKDVVETTLKEK